MQAVQLERRARLLIIRRSRVRAPPASPGGHAPSASSWPSAPRLGWPVTSASHRVGFCAALADMYARRVAAAAVYREAVGITDPQQAVSLLPHGGSPELESAFPLSQRLNDDGPVRGCQSAEIIGISRLYDAATCFDCHGDGMSVCEELGTGTCLCE